MASTRHGRRAPKFHANPPAAESAQARSDRSVSQVRVRYVEETFRDFHIAISHLSADVIPRQLECYFPVRDMDIEVMIDGFEIRDQAIHKTERLHEVLELERSGELVAGELSIRCRLVLVNWLVCCRH